jgi:hypothetical protein
VTFARNILLITHVTSFANITPPSLSIDDIDLAQFRIGLSLGELSVKDCQSDHKDIIGQSVGKHKWKLQAVIMAFDRQFYGNDD